jgi:hypothetical protein
MDAVIAAAKHYLDAGPPFKGDSHYNYRHMIHDAGGEWLSNPKKVKGARDGQVGGWWVAKTHRRLLDLLSLPADNTTHQARWRPLNLDGNAVGVLRTEVADRIALEEQALRAARVAQPQVQSYKEDRQWLGVVDDTDTEIMVLSDRLGVPMDKVPPIVEAAIRWDYLGPRSGMSDAARLIRGLNLKLITPKQVIAGGRTARTALASHKRKDPDELLDTAPSAQDLAAKAARDAARRASALAEAAAANALANVPPPTAPPPPVAKPLPPLPPTPICKVCGKYVWAQFDNSCGCPSV